jgi:hypothetical protein
MRLPNPHLFIPAVALSIVGFALIGPGAAVPFDGAQIWGGPTAHAHTLSLRLSVTERLQGIDSPRDIGELVVEARADDGRTASAHCRTRPDGTADVEVPLAAPAQGRIRATVTAKGARWPLASGFLARGTSDWGGEPRGARLRGHTEGDLSVRVAAKRGVFAAPFSDGLLIEVTRAGAAVPRAEVQIKGEGVELGVGPALSRVSEAGASEPDAQASGRTGEDGRLELWAAPRSHIVDLSVEVRAARERGSFQGGLPVIPGAMWLDPARLPSKKLRVVSAVPRSTAYLVISTRSERLWGGAVELTTDALGFASGELDWPPLPNGGAVNETVWVTVASDVRASGSGTVGWPVRMADLEGQPADGAAAPPLGLEERRFPELLLLDGMPQAERRDAERRARARLLAGAALMAAALLEALLLFEAARSSEKNLQALVEAARAIDPAQALRPHRVGAVMWLAIGVATVVLAFAAVGVVVLWKTGG